jgi:hypothetical protein
VPERCPGVDWIIGTEALRIPRLWPRPSRGGGTLGLDPPLLGWEHTFVPPASRPHLAPEEIEQLRRSIAVLQSGSLAMTREDAMRLLGELDEVRGRGLTGYTTSCGPRSMRVARRLAPLSNKCSAFPATMWSVHRMASATARWRGKIMAGAH